MSANTCERCTKPAHGRFCDEHRRDHGAKLGAQLEAIVADHEVRVAEARTRAAAKIPETCGHEPSDIRVDQYVFYCGRCEDEAVRPASSRST